MILIHENDAPAMDVPAPFNRTLKVLLSPLMGDGPKSIAVGQTILPPGGRSEVHSHGEGEMFYVVSGCGLIEIESQREELIPGTAVWSPSQTSHSLINNSVEELKVLWVLSPPGREADIIEHAHKSRGIDV